jgi:two-component system response regulator MprA
MIGQLDQPTRVLIVEDDPSISAMLRRGLSFEGYQVRLARTGGEALESVRDESPDVVILDLMLPGLDGIEVCRRLRAAGEIMPVLMLTARDEIDDRVIGLDAGADDYLGKPFAFPELLARLRALLRRRDRPADEPLGEQHRYGDLLLDTSTRYAWRGDRRIELTTREFDLLLFFMQHPNQVLPRDLIMERVWGFDFPGESNVLEVYVSNLRRRLEAEGEPRLLQTVRGAGYALRSDGE